MQNSEKINSNFMWNTKGVSWSRQTTKTIMVKIIVALYQLFRLSIILDQYRGPEDTPLAKA